MRSGLITRLFSFWTLGSWAQAPNFIDEVDPNIGAAHSRWFFYTPAANPFGMAKPAASTDGHYGNKWGGKLWVTTSATRPSKVLSIFMSFRLAVMPTVGNLQTVPGTLDSPEEGYRSRFSRETELAQPAN
jgi:hypothetical protein